MNAGSETILTVTCSDNQVNVVFLKTNICMLSATVPIFSEGMVEIWR